jgi:hypothetical protein
MQAKSDEQKKKRTHFDMPFLGPLRSHHPDYQYPPNLLAIDIKYCLFKDCVLGFWCFYPYLCAFGQNVKQGEEGEIVKMKNNRDGPLPFCSERGSEGVFFVRLGM